MIGLNHTALAVPLVLIRWLNLYFDKTDLSGAEIGVYCGATSASLLWLQPKLHLLMVDKWDVVDADSSYGKSGDGLIDTPQDNWSWIYGRAIDNTEFASDRRTIFRGDSVTASLGVEDESLDFVFIDADHSYEGCLRDLRAWAPKIKHDGLIMGHDIDAPEYPGWGVRRAILDFGVINPTIGDAATWCFRKSILR